MIKIFKPQNLYLNSFARIVEDEKRSDSFFLSFYQYFREQSPIIRDKFAHTDWSMQITLLKNMLAYLQSYYETGEASERLITIARSHSRSGYDIPPDLYDHWLNAFLHTLREHDPKCCKKTEQAWLAVLTPGIEFMQSYYNTPTR